MKELISQNGGVLGLLALVAVFVNLILSALSKCLEMIKDKTATEKDNKLHALIQKVVAVTQKIIDWSSANRQH